MMQVTTLTTPYYGCPVHQTPKQKGISLGSDAQDSCICITIITAAGSSVLISQQCAHSFLTTAQVTSKHRKTAALIVVVGAEYFWRCLIALPAWAQAAGMLHQEILARQCHHMTLQKPAI